MNQTNWILVVAMVCSISGCASHPNPLVARKRAYVRLLSFIEPGMTRRELYALLPPGRTPVVQPFSMFTLSGPGFYAPHIEKYPIDADFSIWVQFDPVNPSEYPQPRLSFPRQEKRDGSLAINSNAIDALLFGKWHPKPIKSLQNPDDRIVLHPNLVSTAGPRAGLPQQR